MIILTAKELDAFTHYVVPVWSPLHRLKGLHIRPHGEDSVMLIASDNSRVLFKVFPCEHRLKASGITLKTGEFDEIIRIAKRDKSDITIELGSAGNGLVHIRTESSMFAVPLQEEHYPDLDVKRFMEYCPCFENRHFSLVDLKVSEKVGKLLGGKLFPFLGEGYRVRVFDNDAIEVIMEDCYSKVYADFEEAIPERVRGMLCGH
jgi:hypothetical protein